MKQIKYLTVKFDAPIKFHEVPAFRGAISAKVPRSSVLFHNHDGDKLRYAYPLIQYKRIKGNASLVCLGEGMESVREFFLNKDWAIEVSGRKIPMEITDFNMKDIQLAVQKEKKQYIIRSWMPLSSETLKVYQEKEWLSERIAMLESKLVGNILAMAKGLDWRIQDQIECSIIDIINQQSSTFKKQKMLIFDIIFKTNVCLPQAIGLGRKTGFGYGVVSKWNK
ncbi:CRISPR-associated endonuclease Cas6 [Persicobacter psychrovividus]|uniref:DNA repair protein n=1 Tax=Persicobacter psychrovividus TaxID=387638 RepID=A0ABM7VM71_9BACT|nr:hypothetical protein PEPS_43450 [Persicobacter psychrovividus]